MNLILWRHAEAEDAPASGDDLARRLTANGEKQARKVAAWLDRQLADSARVLCSPALRAQQTAHALGRKFKLHDELTPDSTPARLLELVQWPRAKPTFLVVGHQPVLGQTIAQLLGLQSGDCSIRKGGLWWLRRPPDPADGVGTTVLAVLSPDLL